MSYSEGVRKIFSIQIVVLILGLIVGVFTTRILNPEGRGVVALVLVMVSIMEMIFRSGCEVSLMNYLHKDSSKSSEIVQNAITLGLSSGLLAMLLSILFFEFVGGRFFSDVPYSLYLLAAPRIPLAMLALYMKNIFLAENQFDKSNAVDLTQPILNLILVVSLLAFQSVSPETVLIAGSLACVGQVFWGAILLSRQHRIRLSFKMKLWKELLLYGLKGHASNLIDFFNARLDIILLARFLGVHEVGIYSLAQTAERLQLIPNTFAQALLAKMSKERHVYKEKSHLICRNTVFITFVLAMIAALGGLLIPYIYGFNFESAVYPFMILCCSTVFLAITKTLKSYIYIYLEKPQLSTYASMANLFVNVVCCLYLIPKWGVLGAAIASTAGYCVYAILHLIPFLSATGLSLHETLLIQKDDIKFYQRFLARK